MIKFLLDSGASVNVKDSEGRPTLHLVASLGLTDTLSLMLNYNINLNALDDSGNTALMSACHCDHLDIVKKLVKTAVNINHQNTQGNTALSISSQKGNYAIVNELLSHGAQIYASSRNPIKLAHHGGFTEVVALLQQWATVSYGQKPVPRNSKSVDSLKNKCQMADTPSSLSHYSMQDHHEHQSSSNRKHYSYHMPSSMSMSVTSKVHENSFESSTPQHPYSNRSFIINLNESCETIGSSPKLSRFKIVRDKLMRKSAFIERKSSTNLSQVVDTPSTSKTVSSFKSFISSLQGGQNSSKRASTVEYASDSLGTCILASSEATSLTISSVASPSKLNG